MSKEPGWPADHDIGVYLSVGGLKTLVATARRREDVSTTLRHLADQWDILVPTGSAFDPGDTLAEYFTSRRRGHGWSYSPGSCFGVSWSGSR